MRNKCILMLVLSLLMVGCGKYTAVLKSTDYDFKYEAAKAYYTDGQYGRACELFGSLVGVLKGTVYGEECLYMLAMSNFKARDYESAAAFFKKYYQSYPRGSFVEQARFYSGYSLYKQIPDIRLDQTNTMDAITEFNNFIDYFPHTTLRAQTQDIIFDLQDKLVEKEYLAAKLYYDLGSYMGNCTFGGSNYEACVVTAQNALKDYPYASPARREELSIMVLRSKYHLARESVDEKRVERYRDAIDEFYAFQNDFPESRYLREVASMLATSESIVKRKHINLIEEE